MEDKPNLNDLEILCAVVERGSFRAAASIIGTSQPTVSRAIARLEARLERPLIRRNSRSIAPTQLGLRYAEQARVLLREFAEAEATLLSDNELVGPLSVSVPPALGRRVLPPVIADFCAEHPKISLSLTFENRRVDLVDERVDIAIRLGPLAESWRRQRLLLQGHFHLYGSPEFAGFAGQAIDEILELSPCLVLHSTHLRDRWPFVVDGRQVWRSVVPALKSNDAGALIELTKLGVGITLLPDFMVETEVRRGELMQLTLADGVVPAEVFAMTADSSRSERVEVFLQHVVDRLGR